MVQSRQRVIVFTSVQNTHTRRWVENPSVIDRGGAVYRNPASYVCLCKTDVIYHTKRDNAYTFTFLYKCIYGVAQGCKYRQWWTQICDKRRQKKELERKCYLLSHFNTPGRMLYEVCTTVGWSVTKRYRFHQTHSFPKFDSTERGFRKRQSDRHCVWGMQKSEMLVQEEEALISKWKNNSITSKSPTFKFLPKLICISSQMYSSMTSKRTDQLFICVHNNSSWNIFHCFISQ